MSTAAFDDSLDGLTTEEVSAARSAIAELASIERAAAALEGQRIRALATLASIADKQAARSPRPGARDYARRSLAAEAAPAMRVSPADARIALSTAELITDTCPNTLEALGDGRITRRQAELVAIAASPLDPGARASLDAHAPEWAKGRTSRQFGKIVKKQAAEIDKRSFRERHEAERARRRVTLTDLGEGMSELRIVGPTVETRSVFARLTDMARTIHNDRLRAAEAYERKHGVAAADDIADDHTAGGDTAGGDALYVAATDHRTVGQIRADLLLDMLLSSEPSAHELFMNGSGASLTAIQPIVQVTIPVSQMIDPSEGFGWLDDGTLASPDTLRILAGLAPGWERIFIHEDTGEIAATDRYRPTAEQRRMLLARDMTCRVPGCETAGHACDIDHGLDHALGGPTSIDNLEALCPGHHQMKHQSGWRVRQKPRGVIEFTTPLGQTLTDDPLSRVFFSTAPYAATTRAEAAVRDGHDAADLREREDERFEADDERICRAESRLRRQDPPSESGC